LPVPPELNSVVLARFFGSKRQSYGDLRVTENPRLGSGTKRRRDFNHRPVGSGSRGVAVPPRRKSPAASERRAQCRPNRERDRRPALDLERYVKALGRKLEIHAVFDDADIKLTA
jgi:hypothetical protein